jgi:hypothetical protein
MLAGRHDCQLLVRQRFGAVDSAVAGQPAHPGIARACAGLWVGDVHEQIGGGQSRRSREGLQSALWPCRGLAAPCDAAVARTLARRRTPRSGRPQTAATRARASPHLVRPARRTRIAATKNVNGAFSTTPRDSNHDSLTKSSDSEVIARQTHSARAGGLPAAVRSCSLTEACLGRGRSNDA